MGMKRSPYFRQETDFSCGPAVMRMMLAGIGIRISEKKLAGLLGTTAKDGTGQKAFPMLAERLGLSYAVGRKSSLEELGRMQKQGYFVIVYFFCGQEKEFHYAVLKRLGKSRVFLADPCLGPGHSIGRKEFERDWRSDLRVEKENRWFFALKKAG